MTESTRAKVDRLVRATTGSCDCGVKTPEWAHHAECCTYRLLSEFLELQLKQLAREESENDETA